ncbi:hypothetical protein Y032_0059g2962 [Ancylostoma ceylanicum]|nr:hypothetical protein Y032_0059g2962 [Ancylostoma ceylanicum]
MCRRRRLSEERKEVRVRCFIHSAIRAAGLFHFTDPFIHSAFSNQHFQPNHLRGYVFRLAHRGGAPVTYVGCCEVADVTAARRLDPRPRQRPPSSGWPAPMIERATKGVYLSSQQ